MNAALRAGLIALGTCTVSTTLLAAELGRPAKAATLSDPRTPLVADPRPTATDSEEDRKEERRRRRAREQAPVDPGAAQVIGRIPPSGPQQQPGSLKYSRTPFQIRQSELSLGLDHVLDEHWSVSGWLGQSKGRLGTRESVVPSVGADFMAPQVTATNLRTRSTSLTGGLSWAPRTDVFVDGMLSWSNTRVAVSKDRDDDGVLEGDGRTVARAWVVGAHAGRVWRTAAGQWVPQLGLEYADARVQAYDLHQYMTLNLDGSLGSTSRIGAQHVQIASSVLGLGWQWPVGARFGVWMPHLRLLWRERLWTRGQKADSAGPDESPPPSSLAPRHGQTGALGFSVIWPRGVSAFVDAAYTRASEQVRERRLATGLKFEI